MMSAAAVSTAAPVDLVYVRTTIDPVAQAILKINEAGSQFGTAQNYLSFLGIPIRRVDQITNNESLVS